MGLKHGIKPLIARLSILFSYIFLIAGLIFIMIVILFPSTTVGNQTNPNYGLWTQEVIASNSTINNLGIITLAIEGFILITSIIVIVSVFHAKYQIGKNNSLVKMLVPVVVVSIMILIIGLIDKPGLIILKTNNALLDNSEPLNICKNSYSLLIQSPQHWNFYITESKNIFLTFSYAGYAVFAFCCLTILCTSISLIVFIFKVIFCRTRNEAII